MKAPRIYGDAIWVIRWATIEQREAIHIILAEFLFVFRGAVAKM